MNGEDPRLPVVIAEAGVNHNGDIGRAVEMIAAAADAGADIVKFQAFTADSIVAANTVTADYQRHNTGANDQQSLLRNLELSRSDFATLAACCRDHRIEFLCTAFDTDFVESLVALGMRRIKVASGELTNTPALQHFAGLRLPILLSTGMATLDEVGQAVTALRDGGADDITLLQCTSIYPAPMEQLNLRAMVTMRDHFGLSVGFSDHSTGDHAAVAAVALGATVIEKHFTLDRTLPGPDQAASMEPAQLAAMIKKLKETTVALGDSEKRPVPGELETAQLVRRSWHAARDLAAGQVLDEGDIVLKRPNSGLAPDVRLVGRKLTVARAADAPITRADVV